jgi:hypothetical protein
LGAEAAWTPRCLITARLRASSTSSSDQLAHRLLQARSEDWCEPITLAGGYVVMTSINPAHDHRLCVNEADGHDCCHAPHFIQAGQQIKKCKAGIIIGDKATFSTNFDIPR